MDPRSILLVFALSCQVFADEPQTDVAVQCNLADNLELIYNLTEEALVEPSGKADWESLVGQAWSTADNCARPDYLSWKTIANGLAAARNIIVLYVRDLKYHFETSRIDNLVETTYNNILNLANKLKQRLLVKFEDVYVTLSDVEVKVKAMNFKEVITLLFQGMREYFAGRGLGFNFTLNPITNLLLAFLINKFIAFGGFF